jgi:hypothetical protein
MDSYGANILGYLDQWFFFFKKRNFAKFHSEKYDFNLYKGFSMKILAQIRQISKNKNKFLNRQIFQIFYNKF